MGVNRPYDNRSNISIILLECDGPSPSERSSVEQSFKHHLYYRLVESRYCTIS